MAKITKHAAFLEQLHTMVTKEATAGKATGKPGGDTHPVSVSKETEHVDKNKEGHPEHNPQEFKQEKAKDPSDPTKAGHKSAEETPAPEAAKTAEEVKEAALTLPNTAKAEKATEAPNKVEQKEAPVKKAEDLSTHEKLAELGKQLLEAVDTLNKQATAGTATGKPGADTHYTSVNPKHDHVNKNEEGHPEHNPQEFKQEKAKDESDPTKTHKAAEEQAELDKEASFALGRTFARTFLASKTAASVDLYKEAGRRDFETLIAQASAELDQEAPKAAAPATPVVKQAEEANDEYLQIKQAEEAGAQAFYAMYKQAQEEEQANQIKLAFEQRVNAILAEKTTAEKRAEDLSAKLAAHEVTMQKQAEEARLDAKLATWGGRIVEETIARLKQTPA